MPEQIETDHENLGKPAPKSNIAKYDEVYAREYAIDGNVRYIQTDGTPYYGVRRYRYTSKNNTVKPIKVPPNHFIAKF